MYPIIRMNIFTDFFDSVGSFFSDIYDRIMVNVNGTAQVVDMIGDFRENLQSYLAWIPDSVYMVIAFGFTVCCLYVVIGRS